MVAFAIFFHLTDLLTTLAVHKLNKISLEFAVQAARFYLPKREKYNRKILKILKFVCRGGGGGTAKMQDSQPVTLTIFQSL